jgi:ATP-dependent RNA circularization protein (DNA/RNA ligase family)
MSTAAAALRFVGSRRDAEKKGRRGVVAPDRRSLLVATFVKAEAIDFESGFAASQSPSRLFFFSASLREPFNLAESAAA